MKKVVVLVLLALAAWIGVNYLRTGRLSLLPAAASPAEQHLHDMEAELASIEAQIAQAGRAAGATGIDTSADVSALTARKARLEKEIAAARAAAR
jgi:predicted negative regulator of RcsB-dependent stress response